MKLKDLLNAISSRPLKASNVVMSPQLFNEFVAFDDCIHCCSSKEAHMDDGRCLFAPGTVFEMSAAGNLTAKMANDIEIEEDNRFLALMLSITKGAKK